MKQYDAIIIGFGKAGKTLAAELSNRGWEIAIVERSDKMYGGTCPNIGCIPTKALVHDSKVAAERHPGGPEQQARLYKEAIDRKNKLTALLRHNNYEKLSQRPNVTVYTGIGSFVSPQVVKVTLADKEIEMQGKEIFIDTGSTSVLPPIEGVHTSRWVYTSTSLLELEKLPRHLIIVGGGYIGLEFASMYAGFGSEVTILEAGDRFIPREDEDISHAVREVLEKKGISIRLNARVQSISDTLIGATVTYTDAITEIPYYVEGDAILIATGRKPMTEGLNLEAAGIEVNSRGAIIVDEHLHTSVPHIWAAGDVKGGLQFTYISFDDFRIIRDELFGNKERRTTDREPVSYSVFIDPPLARIGLNEEEARQKGYSFKVSRLPAIQIVRSRTLQETDGLLKAIIDTQTGKILGCTLFCADASEIINIVALAMKADLPYTFLRDFIFTHPSMSEGLNDLFDI